MMFYGVWGVAPSGMRAAAPQLARHGRRACMPKGSARCRASKAYTALHHGEGVWGFGKDAEIERPKALQGRKAHKAFLKGLENLHCLIKTDFFYKLKPQ